MRITEREELLVAELNEFCERQKWILDGMAFFGRSVRKIKTLDKNDPILIILENVENCRRSLRSFMISIYYPGNDKVGLFIEYNNVRFGVYPNYESVNEMHVVRLINLFYADYARYMSNIGAVVAANDHDKKNEFFMPDGLDICENIQKLDKIIAKYCK